MSELNKKGKVRGKRYTAEEKAKVVAFVNEYNSANGRGGQSAASVKFGISQLTVSTWLKGAGAKGAAKASKKGNMQSKLNALLSLGKEIDKLESDLSAKRSKFDAIKASL